MNDSRPGAAVVVGAGLSLWQNAIRALESLGLGERVREHAVETVSRATSERRTTAGCDTQTLLT